MTQYHRCSNCGSSCKSGLDQSTLHFHVEIENLKQRLLEKESHIATMETNILTEVDKFPNGECAALAEEVITWQEKYSRLYEAHKRIQRVNQSLEDKLLKIVDKCETEKYVMTRQVTALKQRLMDANSTITCLKAENERNRNDMNLAIQLIHCKPTNFVPQKFESLPADLQQKVKLYVSSKKKSCDGIATGKHEAKTIKVPIPTFPPTAMFYSVNKSTGEEETEDDKNQPVDIVSAAIVAKILEERDKERQNVRHCDSCICPLRRIAKDICVQTEDRTEQLRVSLAADADIIRVESYQSPSPAVSSVTLIERSPVPLATVMSPTPAGRSQPPQGQLNVGRNRYQSSKLIRGVNRRRDRPLQEPQTARNSEIHIDDSGEVTCDLANLKLLDIEAGTNGPRRCSVSIHPGSSNILLDNATGFSSNVIRSPNPYAFVHSSRSSSTSSVEERPTETQI